MLGRSSIDVSMLMSKNLPNPKMTMPPSKIPNVKNFYDPGDLENNVKVKLRICNKRCSHHASLA